MDISIIVPCKKLEDCIQNLLYSFHMLNLKGLEYEIIFVFDDDKDKTIDVIDSLMKDMNYSIVFSDTKYAGLARNQGLAAASGEFVWFVDGDDWIIFPDTLQMCIPHLREENLNIIQINFVSNLFKMQHYSMVWQYIFKRSFLIDHHISFAPLNKYEDNDFMKQVFNNIEEEAISKFSVPCYFYNYNRPGSVTYQINRGLL